MQGAETPNEEWPDFRVREDEGPEDSPARDEWESEESKASEAYEALKGETEAACGAAKKRLLAYKAVGGKF